MSIPVFLTPAEWVTPDSFTIEDLNSLFIRWCRINKVSAYDSLQPTVIRLGRAEEEQMVNWGWSINYRREAFKGMTLEQADEKVRLDSDIHWRKEWTAGRRYLPMMGLPFRSPSPLVELVDVESHCELR